MFLEFHQERHLPIKTVVDIRNIPEPNLVEHHQQEMLLGTVVPHQLMTTSSPVKQHAHTAPETSGLIRELQVCMFLFGQNLARALAVGYSFKRIGLSSLNSKIKTKKTLMLLK